MPQTPSPLTIHTSALTRLLHEHASYETELAAQESRLQNLLLQKPHQKNEEDEEDEEDEEGNREWMVGQEKRAISETKAVFAPLRERIAEAVERVGGLLESGADGAAASDEEEVGRAKEAVRRGREVLGHGMGGADGG